MILLQLLATTLAVTSSAPPFQLVAHLPACSPNQLSYAVDGEDGAFDGMSHSGTVLVVRNIGPQACRMSALPQLQFEDASDRVLPTARSAPPGMHPGPVVLPVAIAPGAEATSPLYWVSGDVYNGHNCVTSTKVRIDAQGGGATVGLQTQMCGPPGKPVSYRQPPLKTDPVLTPAN